MFEVGGGNEGMLVLFEVDGGNGARVSDRFARDWATSAWVGGGG